MENLSKTGRVWFGDKLAGRGIFDAFEREYPVDSPPGVRFYKDGIARRFCPFNKLPPYIEHHYEKSGFPEGHSRVLSKHTLQWPQDELDIECLAADLYNDCRRHYEPKITKTTEEKTKPQESANIDFSLLPDVFTTKDQLLKIGCEALAFTVTGTEGPVENVYPITNLIGTYQDIEHKITSIFWEEDGGIQSIELAKKDIINQKIIKQLE